MQPYIAEWGGEDLVHSEDGWELGLWMVSPMVGSLELRFYLHISVLSLLPLYITYCLKEKILLHVWLEWETNLLKLKENYMIWPNGLRS